MSVLQWEVGILLFDDVEVLDFAGPFEVFSLAMTENDDSPFTVKTISEDGDSITARNGLKIQPDYSIDNTPSFDILVIPGGFGAEREINNRKLIQWISEQKKNVKIMASVCTGALLLAEAELLKGRKVTTHWAYIEQLKTNYPDVQVQQGVKFVDEDDIITSAGISAGINMSFYIVERLAGAEAAKRTAKVMEYDIII